MMDPIAELTQSSLIAVESRLAWLEADNAHLRREVTDLRVASFGLKLAVCFILTALVFVPCAYALAKLLK